jgi:WD40 repeat protein
LIYDIEYGKEKYRV